jgi:hypothetical protein
MRRLLTWLVVSLGVAAVLRRLRRKSRQPEDVAASDVGSQAEADADDDPADELRRKLAESRVEDESAEPSPASEASVDDRRAEVHDQGRSALDEMRGADES